MSPRKLLIGFSTLLAPQRSVFGTGQRVDDAGILAATAPFNAQLKQQVLLGGELRVEYSKRHSGLVRPIVLL
ncbi:hypothetical protein BDV95DRAFT_569202 [Massariosphaeria phaeospora]|uniref:Uncharacterized protein n=1 Tax=Massariosphaeria phaeospora TaxID=100035 RepID=A0A7C8IAA2_9PLEO|nr:hypothetical protein BDV95DRAFT_569202 [Massariosphaeria phaeospora]